MEQPLWIHGILPTGPVSVRVSKTTLQQFHDLKRKMRLTGDQVLELADGLDIEAFRDETALREAFWALDAGYRPNGRPRSYGKP